MCQVQVARPGKKGTWTSLVGLNALAMWLDGIADGIACGLQITLWPWCTHLAGAQMVLTLKMISAAVCYQDGLKDAKVISLASRSALLAATHRILSMWKQTTWSLAELASQTICRV